MNIILALDGTQDSPLIALHAVNEEDFAPFADGIRNVINDNSRSVELIADVDGKEWTISILKADQSEFTTDAKRRSVRLTQTMEALQVLLSNASHYDYEKNGFTYLDDESTDLSIVLTANGRW